MPFSRSRSAMVLPITLAPATLPPRAFCIDPFIAGSTVEADAIVLPLISSTTCTYMCATLRNTVSRGRPSLPSTRFRIRYLIRRRRSSFVLMRIVDPCRRSGAGLADLLLQLFARVADALLLVRVGFPQAADVGGHLSNQLPVDAGHRDVRLLVDRDIDPVRDVEHDRMRVAERKLHLLPFELGAISDADDVELLLEAFGHAGHRVGHETAGEAVELLQLVVCPHHRCDEAAILLGELDAGRYPLPQLALRPLHLDRIVAHLRGDALGKLDRLLSNSRHC